MGYHGYEEYLCEKGHYSSRDYREHLDGCQATGCKAPFQYRHSVNLTNGSDENVPSTIKAPKREVGFDDQWHEDHYGNKYATKVLRFVPVDATWINIADERAKEEAERLENEANKRYGIQLVSKDYEIWKYLNEYDPVTHTFTFTDSDISQHWHSFMRIEDADLAAAAIAAAIKSNDVWKEYVNCRVNSFWYDLRIVG